LTTLTCHSARFSLLPEEMYWNKSEKWYTMPEMTKSTINMRWYTV
jgi:hypothetical protein